MDIKKVVNSVSAVCWIIAGILAYAMDDAKALFFIVLFSQCVRLLKLYATED